MHNAIITEKHLDEYVRSNARNAEVVIPELIYRLVAASIAAPQERRFPMGDAINQTGFDGILECDRGHEPFVPAGRSFWEIGTGNTAAKKATTDYSDSLTKAGAEVRLSSAFIFITPLSGSRGWSQGAQTRWLNKRRKRMEWREVRIIDGTRIADWLLAFPAVEKWFAAKIGLTRSGLTTAEEHWSLLSETGAPPPLAPDVFLVNRDAANAKLADLFSGKCFEVRLDTHFPDQVVDFVAAHWAKLNAAARDERLGRCLILSNKETWEAMAMLRDPHVVVAGFDLDDAENTGTRLLQLARRQSHAVVYGGRPGGIPHPQRSAIPSPNVHQLEEALVRCGYKKERARPLARQCDGNLSSLKRCLHNLSLAPEWAQGTDAADLAIAQLIGTWNENSEADTRIAAAIAGKTYGEWIGSMRRLSQRPGTPLIQREGVWKFISRYEGWFALGPFVFDDHLERVRDAAVRVLTDVHPKFDLEPESRFAASIHGKVPRYSSGLRKGLSETLALMGSYSHALTSCSLGRGDAVASRAVREVLSATDWKLWATCNDVFPLLAEASPDAFLDCVQQALDAEPSPFAELFKQEGSGVTGSTYMAGLLWALETLAWSPDVIVRTIIALGQLTGIDPGGNWSNRPDNSIRTILLPWFPQTCASIPQRLTTVATLLKEYPHAGWRCLLKLLPARHEHTSGSRKPAWRAYISENWTEGVTVADYAEQVNGYANLAVQVAKTDHHKLRELVEKIAELTDESRNVILEYIQSDSIRGLPEDGRLGLWETLRGIVARHRKHSGMDWALPPATVDRIASAAVAIEPVAPQFRHRRLFSDVGIDLSDEKMPHEEFERDLARRRLAAINEVLQQGGIPGVFAFAKAVPSPWLAGDTLSAIGSIEIDTAILPQYLEGTEREIVQLAGGYTRGRYRAQGWPWVDGIDFSSWEPRQIGMLLAYLPFEKNTWIRAAAILGKDEREYWSRASANAYGAGKDVVEAVEKLIEHDRAASAIRCLSFVLESSIQLNPATAVLALESFLKSSEPAGSMDIHATQEVISWLQACPEADKEALLRIEVGYLPLFGRLNGARARTLERRLADDPNFYCEAIRICFRPISEEKTQREPTERERTQAENTYHLLHDWATPPGSREGGTFDANAFACWLGNVKEQCRKSGHLEVALTQIGHVLVYVPADSDGLWICHAAAKALDAKDADDMRNGFVIELFNSRGVHSWTGGKDESKLAAEWKKRAESVEAHGYHRLAKSLRELADSYERDSKRQATRDPFSE